MAKLIANSGGTDQTPQNALFAKLGLPCLPITHLGVSRLQWVNSILVLIDLPSQT